MSSNLDDNTGACYWCQWCGSVENLRRCGRCYGVYYCCKEHQIQHWKIHKQTCIKQPSRNAMRTPLTNRCVTEESRTNVDFYPHVADQSFSFPSNSDLIPGNQKIDSSQSSWFENTSTCFQSGSHSHFQNEQSPLLRISNGLSEMKVTPNIGDAISSSNMKYMTSPLVNVDQSVLQPYNFENTSGKFDLSLMEENRLDTPIFESSLQSLEEENAASDRRLSPLETNPFLHRMGLSVFQSKQSDGCIDADKDFSWSTVDLTPHWLHTVCSHVVQDMNNYGICVIDNFLGERCGEAILKEVQSMYKEGMFKEGQLVSNRAKASSQAIRGDRTAWVDGTEPNCQSIKFLIRTLDSIISTCSLMRQNGIMGQYRIHGRTKAMIACYPGNGTHYVKHVDNPNQDGRRITSIYYLNKDWKVNIHGGLLRMFPAGFRSQVANIEPIFDRILFFWSDRRNPHEVQAAYAVRFAITVWYLDTDERSNAVMKFSREQIGDQQKFCT